MSTKKSSGLVSLKKEDLVKLDDLKPTEKPKVKKKVSNSNPKTAAEQLEGKSSKGNILDASSSRKATGSSKSTTPAKQRVGTAKTGSSKLDGTMKSSKSKETGNTSVAKKKVVKKKKKKKAAGDKSVDTSKISISKLSVSKISKKSKDKSISRDRSVSKDKEGENDKKGSATFLKVKKVKTKSSEKMNTSKISKASKTSKVSKKGGEVKNSLSKETKPKSKSRDVALKAPDTDNTNELEPPFYSSSAIVGKPPRDPFAGLDSKHTSNRDNLAQRDLTPSRESVGLQEKSSPYTHQRERETHNLSFREKDHFRSTGSKGFNQTAPLYPIQEIIDPRLNEARKTIESKVSQETDFRAAFAKERRQIKEIYHGFKQALHEKELEHVSRLAENYHSFMTEMKRDFDQAELSLNQAKFEANNCWVDASIRGQDCSERAAHLEIAEDRHLTKLSNTDYNAKYKEAQDAVFDEIAEIDAFMRTKKSNYSYVYGIRRDSNRESRGSRSRPLSGGLGINLDMCRPRSSSYTKQPQSATSINSMRHSRAHHGGSTTPYYPSYATNTKGTLLSARQDLDAMLNSGPKSVCRERTYDSATPSHSRKLMRSYTNTGSVVRGKIGDLLNKQEREFDLRKKHRHGPRVIF